MQFTTKTRAWGNSLGITIPKDIVDEHNLGNGSEITVTVKKQVDLSSLRGKFTFTKSTQAIKNEMRETWSND